MTSSRQSARPIATRSEIWRTFEIRVPAARTVADRSASNRRATAGAGGGAGIRRVGTRGSLLIGGRISKACRFRATSHTPTRLEHDRAATLAHDDFVCPRLPPPGLGVGPHAHGA